MHGAPATRNRTSYIVLAIVIVGAAILRFWGLQFGFPHPFARPDEEVIVDTALGLLSDPNPHFFDWPTLFMYVTAFLYAVLFAIERAIGGPISNAVVAKTTFEPVLHLIPRVLAAIAGVATVGVLFGAARELFSNRVALLAAAFLAVAFLHVRDSHFGVTDVPMVFLAMCAFWAGVRCATVGVTLPRAAAAGILGGLAASTKYNSVLIVLPAVIAIVDRTLWNPPRSPRRAIQAIVALGISLAAGFVIGTPYAVLDYPMFSSAVTAVRDHLGRGHVVMARGWPYHAAFTLRYGVGIPLLLAAAAGACLLIARQRRAAALVLPFPVLYYVILGSGLTVFVRYMIPIVPFLCLAAAVCVDEIAERIGRAPNRAVADSAAVALAALLAIPTAWPSVAFDRLMARTDTRVIAGEWISARYPEGASMFQNGYGYGHAQPKPRTKFPQYSFNEQANRFELDGKPVDPPDVLVLLQSPLGSYSRIPPRVAAMAATDYVRVIAFEGITASRAAGALYDQDDMFFAPFSGVEKAARPGPNVEILERRRR